MRAIVLFVAGTVALSLTPALRGQSAALLAPLGPNLHALGTGTPDPTASLPDAPVPANLFADSALISAAIPPCPVAAVQASPGTNGANPAGTPCIATPDPYKRFLDTTTPVPLTPGQKGHLAVRNLVDPGNLITIFGTAAFTIGADSHTAYGPGLKGFGRNTGYSFLQDTTGEFFGTFLIPSLLHEDPHYHRMPHASFPRRFVHSISRTVIAQSDSGNLMPNFSTLLTTPICSELSNLYVPGVRGNGPSTVARIMTGYATDPIGNLITEFLPDVAKHVHIQVIFVQRILNQVASDEYSLP